MQAVKGKHTGPEWIVRRMLYRLGYRYRLHPSNLPGKPDIVFHGRKKAIFVHGCFWHGHGCRIGRPPKSRLDYWLPKLEANKRRDAKKADQLVRSGWSVLTVWQCQTRNLEELEATLMKFVDNSEIPIDIGPVDC